MVIANWQAPLTAIAVLCAVALGSWRGAANEAVASSSFTNYAIPSPCTPGEIITGPDGALWFTEFRSEGEGKPTVFGTIGRVSTTGAFKEQTVSSSRISKITTGPDKALWFTQEGGAGTTIGRITTSGEYTEYPLPGTYNGIGGITSGPDGALWFTEASTDASVRGKIGRMTTTGASTEYTIPDEHSFPNSITTGPDGALWFTVTTLRVSAGKVLSTGKIGRLTLRGAFTEYALPTPFSNPEGITRGPDGALWFTEPNGKIGRITRSGSLTEFKLPSGYKPYGKITTGPDRALWFAVGSATVNAGAAEVGRLTTAGRFARYSIPMRGQTMITGLTSGPDGAIWIAESSPPNGPMIHRLNL